MRSGCGRFAFLAVVGLLAGNAPSLLWAQTSAAAPFGAPVDDTRVFAHALLDQLEGRWGESQNSFRWDGEAWLGTDDQRVWLKSEGEDSAGRVRDGQQQLLYAIPISAYFDLQAGLRYDLDSLPGRGWVALGVEGLAPGSFQTSATLFVGDSGRAALQLTGSYELLLTQRLILQPQAELNAYTRADPTRYTGAGASDLDAGLRLRYEFTRKFAPYVGVSYQRETASGSATAGQRESLWRAVAGVHCWL